MNENTSEFIFRTVFDETISMEFEKLVGDRSFAEAGADISAFAQKHGYDVDIETLPAELKALKEGSQSKDEDMSDEALDGVSGGVLGWGGNFIARLEGRDPTFGNKGRALNDNPRNRQFWLGF